MWNAGTVNIEKLCGIAIKDSDFKAILSLNASFDIY